VSRHCRHCGSGVESTAIACVVCNHSLVRAVRLEGSVGSLEAAIATDVGAAILKRVIGDDARYATMTQFRITRGPDGAWMVEQSPGAKNPTFVNGTAVPHAGHRLADGDQISLAGKAGHVTVRLVVDGAP
jgi:hypothetical protein